MINLEYEKICDEILECDKKIRYVGVYDYGELYDKMRPGLKSYLSREETELSLSQAVYRWSTRKKTAGKIGNPIFALAKYEKIFRFATIKDFLTFETHAVNLAVFRIIFFGYLLAASFIPTELQTNAAYLMGFPRT